jgi:osmoprotectant transport system substrate-binding protein
LSKARLGERSLLRHRLARWAIIAILVVPLSACVTIGRGPQGQRATELATQDDAITIASFEFPESRLLAEIYAQALESKGFEVKRALGLGPRELVEPALEKGLVEFVPEYLGTATQWVSRGTAEASSDPTAGRRALAEAFTDRGVSVLAPAPAQDANAIAVTAQTAATYDLKTISDLKAIAAELVLGGPPECPSRPLCLPGLQKTYGLTFERFDPLDAGGPITVAELASGLIDVAVLFTTDWRIQAKGFVVLDDDLGMQPAENVTPVVRDEILTRYGDPFSEVVDAVSSKLTTSGLAEMNGMVSRNAGTPEAIAAGWLRSKGLVQDEG